MSDPVRAGQIFPGAHREAEVRSRVPMRGEMLAVRTVTVLRAGITGRRIPEMLSS